MKVYSWSNPEGISIGRGIRDWSSDLLNKKEADPLWSCVGKHKTFLEFYCCCMKQILRNPQKAIPFFSKRNCGALFSECLEMPEARLQGCCWHWSSWLPLLVLHLQVLAAGLPRGATCASTQPSRWLPWVNDISGTVCALPERGKMVCVLILIDDLKTDGAGRIECDVIPQVYKNLLFILCLSRCRPWSSKDLCIFTIHECN